MSGNISNTDDSVNSKLVLNRVKFGIFMTLQIPSLLCSLFIFSRYLKRPNIRQSIHHHVVFVLLCSSFVFVVIPVSFSEAFFFTAHVRPESNLFCAFWTWIHYSVNISNLILMCFACAERHWLIFSLNPLRQRRSRILFHYIPIISCMTYPWLFYFVLIFLYPCQPSYNYTQLLCYIPCYFFTKSIGNLDTFMNNWIPIFAIPVLSVALFIRYLLHRRRMRIELFRWKRDRKMVMQLLSVSLLYFLSWGPLQITVAYNKIFLDRKAGQFLVDYLYSTPYFAHLFYPFVVLYFNEELQWRNAEVRPQLPPTGQRPAS